MHGTPTDPRLNLTYDDPVWRQVVGDVRFRTALSHAINREEIIDAIYFGFATPSTYVPSAYDPELANRLLDDGPGPTRRSGLPAGAGRQADSVRDRHGDRGESAPQATIIATPHRWRFRC